MVSKDQDEFSIPVAFDVDGNKYEPTDIDTDDFQAKVTATADRDAVELHDVSYDPVKAIRTYAKADGTVVRAHFALIGTSTGERIGRGERDDKTHERTIDTLLAALNAAGSNLAFTTTVFKKNNEHSEFWRCPTGSDYRWVREPETRQWFPNKKYIQPDLYGFDDKRRTAGPLNKSVVIEVIRTHEPEEETYDRLVELSKVNHLVMFYYCHPNRSNASWLGMMEEADPATKQPSRLRTELYLLDGTFYKSGRPFRSDLDDEKRRAAILNELERIKKL
jgi:hypothetical protein